MNTQRLMVLEDRLNILNKLEALMENNPYAGSYDIDMGDLRLTDSPAAARNHFELLQAHGVASFRFDRGISDLLFWHMPLRIEKIDTGELARMQDHTKAQLIQLDPAYFKATPTLPSSGQEPPRAPVREFLKANRKMVAAAAGIAGFLASLAIIWTFIQTQHW